jgi:hypothetical protein
MKVRVEKKMAKKQKVKGQQPEKLHVVQCWLR